MFTASINTVLATINLLPIPPLDGSKIWPCLIPGLKPSFGSKGIWIFIIAIMFLMQTGALQPVFKFAVNSATHYMPNSDSRIHEYCQKMGERACKDKKFERAEEFFSAAMRFNPRAHHTLRRRAEVRLTLGKLPAALEDIDRAIELHRATQPYLDIRKAISDALERATSQPTSQPASQPADSQ
jgi:tetratricopeptide (TPR) repeat protein